MSHESESARTPRPALAEQLDLQPHPEGGWYRRTWTSDRTVAVDPHPVAGADGPGSGTRPAATLILFLLTPGERSAWHKVASDEVWIWNGGDRITLQFGGSGDAPDLDGDVTLGDAAEGCDPQALVPAGTWQRTLPVEEDALASCMVSPGFDFADFTLGS